MEKMAYIRPFAAIRPAAGMEEQISALPYDVYNRAEAKKIVTENPLSFLAIDRAETSFEESVATGADCVYEKARETLMRFIEEGVLIREPKNAFYIYTLNMNGHDQTGLVSLASIDDYLNNAIKKHEFTRAEKEEDRIRHVDKTNFHTGPIFLVYRQSEEIRQVVENAKAKEAIYSFVADDGVKHEAWIIDQAQDIQIIKEGFQKIPELYE